MENLYGVWRVRLIRGCRKRADVDCTTLPSDDRQYRAITLPNGLVAMVVSDPEADQGAACLNVGVGHLCDPVRTSSRCCALLCNPRV